MEPILSADDTWYIKYTIHPMTEPKLMAYIYEELLFHNMQKTTGKHILMSYSLL